MIHSPSANFETIIWRYCVQSYKVKCWIRCKLQRMDWEGTWAYTRAQTVSPSCTVREVYITVAVRTRMYRAKNFSLGPPRTSSNVFIQRGLSTLFSVLPALSRHHWRHSVVLKTGRARKIHENANRIRQQ